MQSPDYLPSGTGNATVNPRVQGAPIPRQDVPNDPQYYNIPQGLEQEVYQVSVMAIDLDNAREVDYFRNLSMALRITPEHCNHLHQQYGARGIF